jgi:glutaredoxin
MYRERRLSAGSPRARRNAGHGASVPQHGRQPLSEKVKPWISRKASTSLTAQPSGCVLAGAAAAAQVALLLPGPSAADIYRWVDDEGRPQFSDRPAPGQVVEQVRLGPINTFEGVAVEPLQTPATGPSGAGRPSVVMYSTSWCGVCSRAKRFLAAEGIPYTDHDIEADPDARAAYDRLGGRGVPLLLIGDRRMHGFSKGRFAKVYGTLK